MMNTEYDNIELTLPFKAEYVSVARLVSSSIASRIGFDIDTIEDIKVAIAEVCNKFVQVGSQAVENYKIVFEVSSDKFRVLFYCDDSSLGCIFGDGNEELGVSIMSALMDDVDFCTNNEYLLSMSKVLREN